MPRRSITDEEIGLIKTMLARGMRNRDIQFYFNRQDRPVNSGRITGIRAGGYGPEVPQASEADLEAFLAGFAPATVGVVVQAADTTVQTIADRARARFERRADELWYLIDGETSDQECKSEFNPRRMEPVIKAIAAMANNRGGFIFIGVSNAEGRVSGMPDQSFQTTDIVRLTDKAKSLLVPTPNFSKETIAVGGHEVGVIHVEKYRQPPIVVCRDAHGMEDGTILFRYPGQSAKIKFGDLHALLRERDRDAHASLLSSAARLSEIGTDRALLVDAHEGKLDVGGASITIDRALAEQLEFIHEGQFEEKDGSPTLRLLGDVRAVDEAGQVQERVVGRALTADMAVKAFLSRQHVRSPMEYVRLPLHVRRQWIPLHYFIRQSGQTVEQAIEALEASDAVYQAAKTRALERLRGETSAFTPLSGHAVPVGREIDEGRLDGLVERHQPALLARAIQGLPDGFHELTPLLEVLDALFDQHHGDSTIRGFIYRAACRIDEIEAATAHP